MTWGRTATLRPPSPTASSWCEASVSCGLSRTVTDDEACPNQPPRRPPARAPSQLGSISGTRDLLHAHAVEAERPRFSHGVGFRYGHGLAGAGYICQDNQPAL